MVLVVVSDLHLRAGRMRYRKDDPFATALTKLRVAEQFGMDLMEEHGGPCTMLVAGDFFDRPAPPPYLLKRVMEFLDESRIGSWLMCPGQHDVSYYRPDNWGKHGIGLVDARVGKFKVIHQMPDTAAADECYFLLKEAAYLTVVPELMSVHFTGQFDGIEDWLRSHSFKFERDEAQGNAVWVLHAMATEKYVPWPHVLIEEIETDADLVVCGDYHPGFGPVVVNGTTFVSPGALLREGWGDRDRTPRAIGFWLEDGRLLHAETSLTDSPAEEVLVLPEGVAAEDEVDTQFFALVSDFESESADPLVIAEELVSERYLDGTKQYDRVLGLVSGALTTAREETSADAGSSESREDRAVARPVPRVDDRSGSVGGEEGGAGEETGRDSDPADWLGGLLS